MIAVTTTGVTYRILLVYCFNVDVESRGDSLKPLIGVHTKCHPKNCQIDIRARHGSPLCNNYCTYRSINFYIINNNQVYTEMF